MSTGNRFPVPKTPEERAEYVAAEFERSGQQIAVYVKQLRRDFRALKPGETIMGCRTWTAFCTKVLKRTTRAVRYIVAGGNPRWKRKPSKDDWQEHWGGMPDFGQNDLTPFKTIYVHFENQEHVAQFAELVGQRITPKTRYIWYPKAEKAQYADKRYVDVEDGINQREGEAPCEVVP
jgi:hypothetical protein